MEKKILTKEEQIWLDVKESAERMLTEHEKGIIFNKALLELAKEKLK